MKHLKKGRILGRTSGQRKALLRSMAGSLFLQKSITTTLAKAKELRPFAEKLITKARTNDFNKQRLVNKLIAKEASSELFEKIGPFFKERKGGYLRIIKLMKRSSDYSKMAIIELVDFKEEKEVAKKDSESPEKEKVSSKKEEKKVISKK
jgi:large subunit ribosomal protein L17